MREQFQRQLQSPTTRGVHHLALCTDDMKATIDFYVEVLGMPLVHAMKVPPGLGTGKANRGNPPYEQIRHYFFDMGNDSLLAFFEIPNGIRLEFCCQPQDSDDQQVLKCVRQTEAELQRELRTLEKKP